MNIELISAASRLGAAAFALLVALSWLVRSVKSQIRFSKLFNAIEELGQGNVILGLVPLTLNGESLLAGLWSHEKFWDYVWELNAHLVNLLMTQPAKLRKYYHATLPCVIVAEPAIVKHILSSADEAFQWKPTMYKFLGQWIGDSFLTSQPAKDLLHRKLFAPSVNHQVMAEACKAMNRSAESFVRKMATMGHSEDMVKEATELTLLTLCKSLLYHRVQVSLDELHAYREWSIEVSRLITERGLKPHLYSDFVYKWTPSGSRFCDLALRSQRFTAKIVNRRMAELIDDPQPEENVALRGKTPLDMAIQFQQQGILTRQEMHDIVDTIMMAGHDTTGIAISHMIYLLGHNEAVQAKARAEVDALWDKYSQLGQGGQLTMEMIGELEYMNCCIKETLRLYPSTPVIGRKLAADTMIKGQLVPKGVNLVIHLWAMHRDGRFFPRPDAFEPERFLKANNGDAVWAKCAPFSGGARGCLGRKYATLELQVTLAKMLRQVEWKSLVPESDYKVNIKLVMHPRDKIPIKFWARMC